MNRADNPIRPSDVDILIAEDSPTQAEQLRFLLAEHGFRVTVATNGRQALAAALAHPPTLLITDIVMPEMDGYELCTAIKADARLQDVPVVMVTSLAGVQDIARSLECGADNFIRKPYDPHTLLTRIESMLFNLELRKTSKPQVGMEIYLGGKKHCIASGREQIIDLLIATYEEAVHMNAELQLQQQEISLSNRTLRVLYRIAGEMNRVSTEAEVCELALHGVMELPDFNAGWIFLDDGGWRTAATCQLPAALLAPEALDGDCRCRRMLRMGELRHEATVVDCERLQRPGGDTAGLRAHISMPLMVGGQCLGLMNVAGTSSDAFSGSDLRLLDAIGNQVAIAIQRARLYHHLEAVVDQRTAALQTEIVERTRAEQKVASLNRIYAVLSGINTTIVRVHDRDTLFREACRIAVRQGKFRLAWIGLLDADGQQLQPVAWMCENKEMPDSEFMLSVNENIDAQHGMFGRVVLERVTVTCNDLATADEEIFPLETITHGCRSMAIFPLQLEGRTMATLALYAAESGIFDTLELALLNEMAGDISFALGYLRKEEQLDYLAYYDALTGLPNRKLIQDRLQQLLQAPAHDSGEHGMVALLLINIDRFKNINDTFGRHVGDALLQQVALRLGEAQGGTDHLARIGNDHFAVILTDVNELADVAHRLDGQIIACLGPSFSIEGHELHVTFKLGIALFPSDSHDVETLFANAETALFKATASPERYLFYAPAMNARVSEQLSLENKLHRAMENGEFELYYQPKVELEKGSIIGLEALIRWNDPEAGLVSPTAFIPLLEETGMIIDVGRWALERAITDHAAWQAEGLQPPRVAVNVSAVQLRRKDFLPTLESSLSRHPGISNFLDLELTESLLMEDIEANVQRLGAVREMGMKIAVDDFGTGYSSLSYLKRFPIDYLKIDQSFVRDITTDPDAAAICLAVVGLAHNLRLTVIAEGVETEGQMNFLRRHRCDELQGYLFSRPLPAGQFAQLLREHRSLPLPAVADSKRKTLLLVDDEANILAALKRVLRRDGYEILTVGSAAEGFDVLANHEVQVIISDQRMPGMSGTEFLARVKNLYPDTIRIVLSGYSDIEAITEAVNRGAIYRFLSKPWNDEQLCEHVREAFRHYETGQRKK